MCPDFHWKILVPKDPNALKICYMCFTRLLATQARSLNTGSSSRLLWEMACFVYMYVCVCVYVCVHSMVMNLVVTWLLLIAPNTDPYIPMNDSTQPAAVCPLQLAAGSQQPCLLLSFCLVPR